MTDQTPPAKGESEANEAQLKAEAAAKAEAEAAAKAEAEAAAEAAAKAEAEAAEAKAKADADEAARAAGFADAATKAAFDAAAAAQKPKRAPRTAKAKAGGFSVKAPTAEQHETLVGMAAAGGIAQFVLSDGRKPIEGVNPATAALMLRRGRATNGAAIAFTGAGLDRPVTVTHVFALDADDKPTAQPLAICELAAPVHIGTGEQFRIDAGGLAFFPPAAAAAAG